MKSCFSWSLVCILFISINTTNIVCATEVSSSVESSTISPHIRTLAASCAACHGSNGNSAGITPTLAGLDDGYFITQMLAFKDGSRPATVMHHHAKGLNIDEINLLANYFETQKRVTSHPPKLKNCNLGMNNMQRRDFIKNSIKTGLVLSGSSLINACSSLNTKKANSIGRVVVIGGGYAGLATAKYIRMWSANTIDVVVIEKSSQFVSCPLSNLVLGGSKTIHDLTFSYDLAKKNHGITWVSDEVTAIDAANKKVSMKRGEISYDRLIIAPGVDMKYDKLPNLEAAQSEIPHAWKAGWQTVILRQQLEAMHDGGVFAISVPRAPYRCPPGPYERACQVASYFKTKKPKSKVIVLDANPEITSKKGLFTKVFNETYAGIVDYRANSVITELDVNTKTVKTEFETVQANVLNIIPPQRAGKPAQLAKVDNVENRWCEVSFLSYESTTVPNVHVIGDAIDSNLPKSAHMATNQARICASAIVEMMANRAPDPAPVFANTCYSFINDQEAIHVATVYRYDASKKIMVAAEGGGVSMKPSAQEGDYAQAWAMNIWSDVLT